MDRIELSELIDINIACEHSFHETDNNRHNGNAEYIQHDGECECPARTTAFVCSKWRTWVSDLARSDGKLYCRECKTSFPAHTITYTKI